MPHETILHNLMHLFLFNLAKTHAISLLSNALWVPIFVLYRLLLVTGFKMDIKGINEQSISFTFNACIINSEILKITACNVTILITTSIFVYISLWTFSSQCLQFCLLYIQCNSKNKSFLNQDLSVNLNLYTLYNFEPFFKCWLS
jgi:hypothetical protein